MRNKKLKCKDCQGWDKTCNNHMSKHYQKTLPDTQIACPMIIPITGTTVQDELRVYYKTFLKNNKILIKDLLDKSEKSINRKEPFYIMIDHGNPDNSFIVNKDGTTDPPEWEEVMKRSKAGNYERHEIHKINQLPTGMKNATTSFWLNHTKEWGKPLSKERSSRKSSLTLSKQQKKNKIASIKKSLIKSFGKICMLSGDLCEPEAFHIFPVGKYPEYEICEWNIILTKHEYNGPLWDQGLWENIQKMPSFHMIMKTIWDKDHDPNKLHAGSFYEQLMNRENK